MMYIRALSDRYAVPAHLLHGRGFESRCHFSEKAKMNYFEMCYLKSSFLFVL